MRRLRVRLGSCAINSRAGVGNLTAIMGDVRALGHRVGCAWRHVVGQIVRGLHVVVLLEDESQEASAVAVRTLRSIGSIEGHGKWAMRLVRRGKRARPGSNVPVRNGVTRDASTEPLAAWWQAQWATNHTLRRTEMAPNPALEFDGVPGYSCAW